jgi:hypothetical protein
MKYWLTGNTSGIAAKKTGLATPTADQLSFLVLPSGHAHITPGGILIHFLSGSVV